MSYEAVVYKQIGSAELKMWIYRPEHNRVAGHGEKQPSEGQRPGIVMFICGGWGGFSPDKAIAPALYFAARGAVCFVTQVRVKPVHNTTPAECLIDAKSAVRWVREHAAQYGVDPQKIVCSGGSASGHVSACTALIDDFNDSADNLKISARPNAVAIFCPVLVVYHTQARIQRFGGKERARALSPILHVRPDAPPFLIQHGANDDVVAPEEATLFQNEMKKVGVRCEVYFYMHEGHGCHNYFDGKNAQFYIQYRVMDRFLASLQYLHGEPTINTFPFAERVQPHEGIE